MKGRRGDGAATMPWSETNMEPVRRLTPRRRGVAKLLSGVKRDILLQREQVYFPARNIIETRSGPVCAAGRRDDVMRRGMGQSATPLLAGYSHYKFLGEGLG